MSELNPSANTQIEVVHATSMHLDKLHRLFEAYRNFYQMPPAPETSKKFLKERFESKDSIILLALKEFLATGFCQIYPSYSSVAMKPIWILNDLFVDKDYRKCGVAQLLIKEVEKQAKRNDVFSIKLATAVDNKKAQSLYFKLGYQQISNFDHFSKRL